MLRKDTQLFKVPGLDFVRPYHSTFEWLILHCQRSVGPASWLIYYTLSILSKKVGLIDIGVIISTHWWHHAFCISPIFLTSRPKLWKWPNVPGKPHVGLHTWKVLRNSMRASRENLGWIFSFFSLSKFKITLSFRSFVKTSVFHSNWNNSFTVYYTCSIELL